MLANSRKQATPSKKVSSKGKPNPQRPKLTKSMKQASVAAAYATPNVGKAPTVRATRDHCNIVHRELIQNISGSVNFSVGSTFSVNPGLSATFPWLSIMAQGWEEYRFRKLRFCYYTRTGSNTPGSVIMAPDYDAADVAPATEQIMSSYAQVIEDAPWKDICCEIKQSNLSGALGKRHFVRNGSVTGDIKTYDVCNFFVATTDGTAIPWGKLWVEYDIDFFIPQLPAQGAIAVTGGNINGGGTISAANPLGSAPVLHANSDGITVDDASAITFSRAGTYLLSAYINGTVLTDLTLLSDPNGAMTNLFPVVVDAAGVSASKTYTLLVNAVPCVATMSVAGTTCTLAVLDIATVPDGSLL